MYQKHRKQKRTVFSISHSSMPEITHTQTLLYTGLHIQYRNVSLSPMSTSVSRFPSNSFEIRVLIHWEVLHLIIYILLIKVIWTLFSIYHLTDITSRINFQNFTHCIEKLPTATWCKVLSSKQRCWLMPGFSWGIKPETSILKFSITVCSQFDFFRANYSNKDGKCLLLLIVLTQDSD